MMERHGRLNINNAIVAGIFHKECYPSINNESYSYHFDNTSISSNNSNNRMPGLNDRALKDSLSDKESMTVADEYIKSEYHSNDNNNTVYKDSVSDDNSHTQDNEEYSNNNSTYHTQENEESIISGSTSEVIQNIDMLNQDDRVININQRSYDKTTKLVRHFMEGCNMPYYTILTGDRITSGMGLTKNILLTPGSSYVMGLYFDNNEYKQHLRPKKSNYIKGAYTCNIHGSYLYIDPTDKENKKLFASLDFC